MYLYLLLQTRLNFLDYLVESPPLHGYIEDISPKPGFQTRHGARTTSFTHNQLMNGYIRYQQSEHEGVEPTSDQFAISVTDGQYKSAKVSCRSCE